MCVFSIPFDEMEVGINPLCTSKCLCLSQREKLTFSCKLNELFFFFLNEIPTIVTWNEDQCINYGYSNSRILENIFLTTHRESDTSTQTTDRMRDQAKCKGNTSRWSSAGGRCTGWDSHFCIIHKHRQCCVLSGRAPSYSWSLFLALLCMPLAWCENCICSCSASETTCFKAWGWKREAAPYLDRLRGVRERQCVDAAGGQTRLECLPAVSEDDLFILGKQGVWGCFSKIGKLLKGVCEKIKADYFEMHLFVILSHLNCYSEMLVS